MTVSVRLSFSHLDPRIRDGSEDPLLQSGQPEPTSTGNSHPVQWIGQVGVHIVSEDPFIACAGSREGSWFRWKGIPSRL